MRFCGVYKSLALMAPTGSCLACLPLMDMARLSLFVRRDINMLGRYFFQLPDLPGGLRPLRDKGATDEE